MTNRNSGNVNGCAVNEPVNRGAMNGTAVISRIVDERIRLLLEQAAGYAMRQWGPGSEYDFLTKLAKEFANAE